REWFLLRQDPEGVIDRGEVGGKVCAGMPAKCPIDELADQFSPGNALCFCGLVQCGGLALGEVDVRALHTPHYTPELRHRRGRRLAGCCGFALRAPVLLGLLSSAYRADLRRLGHFAPADQRWLRSRARRPIVGPQARAADHKRWVTRNSL